MIMMIIIILIIMISNRLLTNALTWLYACVSMYACVCVCVCVRENGQN